MQVCITFCRACIIYVHSTSPCISRACVHLSIHEHLVPNDTRCESLDMNYQYVANVVIKTPTARNSVIILAMSKKFLADYLLKSPSNGEGHHLASSSLEVVIDKISIFASSNCRDFVSCSNHFVCCELGMMDCIMALKDHSGFKYVHDSRFPEQSKDKIFVFRMSSMKWCGSCKTYASGRRYGKFMDIV